VVDLPLEAPITPGQSGAAAGEASFAWLTRAAELVMERGCKALVTAPIAKASWHAAGHAYPGQTERLAELAGVPGASMLFTARAPRGTLAPQHAAGHHPYPVIGSATAAEPCRGDAPAGCVA
jgi:4-hydroxythreonine-4-phosphate dehydrogenase